MSRRLQTVLFARLLQVPGQGAAKEDGQYPVRKRAFLEGHTSEYVRCVAFSPDGRLLASQR
jgi:hypothetical protein